MGKMSSSKRAKWYETRLLNLLAEHKLIDDSCRVSCDDLNSDHPNVTIYYIQKDQYNRFVDRTKPPTHFTLQELLKYDSEAVKIENKDW